MPIKLSRALFLKNVPRAVGETPMFEEHRFATATMAQPVEERLSVGVYRIHRALHAANPGTHALMEMRHGAHLLVTLHPQDGLVGFVRRDLLWVHPDHRGHKLGSEMGAQLLVEMGCEDWDLDDWNQWLGTPRFTVSGYHTRSATYDILVRRGIIDIG